jgi:hypothetical protein
MSPYSFAFQTLLLKLRAGKDPGRTFLHIYLMPAVRMGAEHVKIFIRAERSDNSGQVQQKTTKKSGRWPIVYLFYFVFPMSIRHYTQVCHLCMHDIRHFSPQASLTH